MRTPTSSRTRSRNPNPSSWITTPSTTPTHSSTWSMCSCPLPGGDSHLEWRLRPALAPTGRERAPPLPLAVRYRRTHRLSDPSGRPQPGRVPRSDPGPDPSRRPASGAVDDPALGAELGAQALPARAPGRVGPDRTIGPLGLRERSRRRGRGTFGAPEAVRRCARWTASLTAVSATFVRFGGRPSARRLTLLWRSGLHCWSPLEVTTHLTGSAERPRQPASRPLRGVDNWRREEEAHPGRPWRAGHIHCDLVGGSGP
jgi:hypothetical protein